MQVLKQGQAARTSRTADMPVTIFASPAPTARRSVQQIMLQVMLALVPGTALLAWALGAGVVINVIAAIVLACGLEALTVRLRGRSVTHALGDGSITLAAWLLALAVPPWLPLWQLAVGVAGMVWLGKHLYGGLGHNPFNPAMTGYAVLMVSFPVTMTTWPAIDAMPAFDLSTTLQVKLFPDWPLPRDATVTWDAITGATPLDAIRTLERSMADIGPGSAPSFPGTDLNTLVMTGGFVPANTAFLVGGLYLLWRRVIRWHIPVAVLGTLALCYLLQWPLSTTPQPGLPLSLLSGAAILGAFFIATDPVSAATGNIGRLIYGGGIGVLTFVIREYGGYPEGLAFAVLIMNCTVPAIDYWSTGRR